MRGLLLRPSWIEGESWPGFLLRVAKANALSDGMNSLGAVMGIKAKDLLMTDPSIALVQLGYSSPSIEPDKGPLDRGPRAMPFRSGRSRYVAFCSKCLSEDVTPHMRAYWDRPFQFECTLHKSGLHRVCPSCLRPVSALRRTLERCDCGHLLAASGVARAPDGADVLRRVLLINSTTEVRTFEGASQQDLSSVLLVQRMLHVVRSAELPRSKKRKPRLTDVWISDRDLNDAINLFRQWPTSFEQGFLQKIERSKSPSDLLGSCYGFSLAQFPDIEKAIRDVNQRRRCSPRPKGAPVAQQAYMSIKELITKSGIHYNDIKKWIANGFLGPVTVQEAQQGKRYLIPIEHAHEAIGFIKRTSSMLAAQREIGLSRRALNALSKAGLLQATRIGRATYTARLDPTEVYAAANSVLMVVRTPDREHSSIRTLSQAIVRVDRSSPSGSVAKFWHAITSGQLPVYRTDEFARSLESVYLCAGELTAWRSAHRA